MSDKSVLVEKNGAVASIILNRPSALNSMNKELVNELIESLHYVQNDATVRAVVLTGAGKAFCAGGDLNYLLSLKDIIETRSFIAKVGSIVEIIMNMDKPVIAMVNGVAAGAGFNLALACDIIYCGASARFAQSFAKVGLVPDCGGMYLLPRIVGRHKAKELMFTGDLIDSAVASKLGLVNQVVEEAQLKETTYQFAEKLASSAPIALGLMKRAINRNDNLDLSDSLALEANLQCICMQTEDHQEGVAAFKEKRSPVFQGK